MTELLHTNQRFMKHLLTLSFVLLVNLLFSQGAGSIKPKYSVPDTGGPNEILVSHVPSYNAVKLHNFGAPKLIMLARITNINTGETSNMLQNTTIQGFQEFYVALDAYLPGVYDVDVFYRSASSTVQPFGFKRATLRFVHSQ